MRSRWAAVGGVGILLALGASLDAGDIHFSLPGALTIEHNPDGCVWTGMRPDGQWRDDQGHPIPVSPRPWLTSPVPGPCSGVTLPTGHWIELAFPGTIVDGNTAHPCQSPLPPGTDLVIFEKDANAERALVFLASAAGDLFLVGEALSAGISSVPDPNCAGMVKIGFDLAGRQLPFAPRAVRLLSRGLGGGAPGFDVAQVWARIEPDAAASCPWPPPGAADVPPDVTLTWTAGHDALGHSLVLGTDANAVAAAAEPNAVFLADEALAYPLAGLRLGTAYHWRVDALPEANDAPPVRGPVWTFTVAQALDLDDFEAYGPDQPLEDAWRFAPGTLELAQLPPEPHHPGCQHLRLPVSPTPAPSLLRRFEPPLNARAHPDVTHLSLDLRSESPLADAATLTLSLGDSAGHDRNVADPDLLAALRDGGWHTWSIPLSRFAPVDTRALTQLSLTLAAPAGTLATGQLGIDRLRLGRDETSTSPPALPPILEPNTPPVFPGPPRAHYPFDDPLFGIIQDSRNEFLAYWISLNGAGPHYEPGFTGLGLDLAVDTGWATFEDPTPLHRFREGISIAFWQNGADTCYDTDTLLSSEPQYERGGPVLGIALGAWERPGRLIWRCGEPNDPANRLEQRHAHVSEWQGRWNHWVCTKDFSTGRLAVYHNGRLWAEAAGRPGPLPRFYELNIGNGWLSGHDGLIDELRIYDYPLTEAHAAWLAARP